MENEFLKKTPSSKFGLESQLGTFDFGVCQKIFLKDLFDLIFAVRKSKCEKINLRLSTSDGSKFSHSPPLTKDQIK